MVVAAGNHNSEYAVKHWYTEMSKTYSLSRTYRVVIIAATTFASELKKICAYF